MGFWADDVVVVTCAGFEDELAGGLGVTEGGGVLLDELPSALPCRPCGAGLGALCATLRI